MFALGSQCGLKPDEVLDLSLDVFNAYVQGYTKHLLDLQLLGVQQGYWSGYYSRAKHPKKPSAIMRSIVRQSTTRNRVHSAEVDVEAFKAQEQKFWEQYNSAQEGC